MSNAAAAPSRDEPARLTELHSLNLLDTPHEERFDQYTRLVADVLNVPTVLVSLVDEQRQWFKSVVGLDCRETARSDAFCDYALYEDFLEVPDATQDPRFKDNRLVTGAPYIRFYAGAVLFGPTRQPLGTLCVIDSRPRRLSKRDKTRLIAFARLVEQELDQQSRFKTWAQNIQHDALHDAITGLPESGLLEEHLTRTLAEAAASGQAVAVAELRLTNFDALTTLEGRRGGDQILKTITSRLRQCVRPADQIGRLGPDRIAVIIPSLSDAQATLGRVRRLVDSLIAPVEINSASRPVRIAAGVSQYPANADNAADLLDQAQAQAAVAAATGEQGAVYHYSRAGHADASRRHDQTHRLASALQNGGLQQVYQPILTCQKSRPIAVEALARWHDVVYGPVSPGEFVPLAESHPELRRALTEWSLSSACRQLAVWRRNDQPIEYIAVNVPSGELNRPNFVETVAATLRQHDIDPRGLVLEVTEQSLITDLDSAVATMNTLRASGVRFAVDDFGTGYSSLRYLQQLPLDILKIDRSFIDSIVEDSVTRELTDGILRIAHTLGLSVVAEGIETAAQHRVLQRLGCAYAQGFLFGKPSAANEVSFARRALEPLH